MNNISNIRQLALESVNKYKDLPIKNITFVVESELDFWESTLFPIYDSLYLPRYQTLIDDFLTGAGFDVSVKKLTNTVFYVKEKRKKKALKSGAVVGVPGLLPGQAVQVQAVAVQPSIGGVGHSGAVVPSPVVAVVTQEPVARSGGSGDMADSRYGVNIPSYVVRADSVVAPADFDSYPVELERLRNEKEAGFTSSWSGVDETIYQEFRKELFDFSYMQIKESDKLDFFNGYLKLYLKKAFKNKYDDETLEHYSLLLQKLRVQSR